MKNDDLSWLCAELGLPVLEETADGLLAGPAAQAALRTPASSLEAAAAALMGLSTEEPALCAALTRARAGERAVALTGTNGAGHAFRLLALPVAGKGPFVRLAMAQVRSTGSEGLIDVAAAVSHEVANAVGSIRGWADLALHRDDATVDLRDALTLIRGAARSAEQAARSMLAVARGESQSEAVQRLDFSEFAAEFVHLLTLTARQARVTLESSIQPALFVQASRAQLFTIVFNLVKNAIEACAPGGLVSVHLTADAARVQLTVRDSGIGLDSAAKQRIFERYYTTKANGSGLGLALVQSAVDASGAEIQVESAQGRGTLFCVTFTRAPEQTEASEGAASWPSATHEPSALSSHPLEMRVLVVDDDHALREMVATALSLRGAHVTSVRSAEEALRVDAVFDIALIDMMLDDVRGDELLALLRQRGTVSAAMLVTGTVQKPRLVPGGEPDDWLRKPFDISQLVERMRRTLERHRMLQAAGSSARA